jgi:DHA1 family bicyclomycin/chloramphenicol resistance-like MFS transporter
MSCLRLAILLGASVAISPLAMDAYLPAFPDIAAAFGVPVHRVGLTLGVFLLGLSVGHVVGGPLSDAYGRDRVMLFGVALFGLGSLLSAISPNFEALMAFRLVQAIGAGACVVSVPAIARDHTSGSDAARLFSLIGLVIFIAPAVAPTLGTVLVRLWDWPAIFVFLAVYAAVLLPVLRLTLFAGPQPRPVQGSVSPRTLIANYGRVLGHAPAMRILAVQSLVFSVMMVFLTNGSFIFQEWYGLSHEWFSAIMAGIVAIMAAFNLSNRWLLRRFAPAHILRAAVGLQVAALVYVVAVASTDPPLAAFLPGVALAIGSFGAGMPNSFSLYLESFYRIAATASAVMGVVRFAVAGVISGVSSVLVAGELLNAVAMMLACAAAALALAWGVPRTMEGVSTP